MAALTLAAEAALTHIPYTGAPLDRGDTLRRDPDVLARLRRAPGAHVLVIWRNRVLVREQPSPETNAPQVIQAPADWVPPSPTLVADEEVFLGVDPSGTGWFAMQVATGTAEMGDPVFISPTPETGPDVGLGGVFLPLRALGPVLPADMAAILAQALGILAWHRRHRFCATCGAPSHPDLGGWRRLCSAPGCGAQHFPRTDPAVIMLVSHGVGESARCLLAHSPRMPQGLVSTLAGFVEPGESLEEAVRREVWEETGVRVGTMAYAASQPWPFPASLMVGFHAQAETTALTLDAQEIESAAWFNRAQVRYMLAQAEAAEGGVSGMQAPETAPPGTDGLRMPAGDSLARRLIQGWLAGDPLRDTPVV